MDISNARKQALRAKLDRLEAKETKTPIDLKNITMYENLLYQLLHTQREIARSKQCPVCHCDEGSLHLQECAARREGQKNKKLVITGGMRMFSDWGG